MFLLKGTSFSCIALILRPSIPFPAEPDSALSVTATLVLVLSQQSCMAAMSYSGAILAVGAFKLAFVDN